MVMKKILKTIKDYNEKRVHELGISVLKITPNNPKYTLCIAHNKELCDISPFFNLLKLFQTYDIEGHQLQQNINNTIISFKTTIYETYLTLENINRNLINREIDKVHFVSRIGRNFNSSYFFFNTVDTKSLSEFAIPMLEQMVMWMQTILTHFEKHKTSQDEFDEAFCMVTYRNLDIFYDFFYCLLCHIVNIRCDQYKRISIYLPEDI